MHLQFLLNYNFHLNYVYFFQNLFTPIFSICIQNTISSPYSSASHTSKFYAKSRNFHAAILLLEKNGNKKVAQFLLVCRGEGF